MSRQPALVVQGTPVEIRPQRRLSIAHHRGQADADTVLFFAHGGGGNKDQWREQWQTFAAAGYSLVAWDLLGHGASDRPGDPAAYAWSALVEDQLAVLQRYAGTRNVLIGHSYGSGLSLASLLALQARGQETLVDAVLLLGTQLQRPLSKGGLLSLPVWLLKALRPLLARGFRQRAWHPAADPDVVAYEEALTRGNSLAVFKALTAQAAWPTPAEIATLRVRPVHILAGDHDGLTPAERGRALHERLPGSRFEILARCGHQLMLEQPGLVSARLHRLLADQAAGTSRPD